MDEDHRPRPTRELGHELLLARKRAKLKATRDRVHRIASEQDIGHFLRVHNGLLSDNLLCLMIHERAALTMHKYETMLVPGLLQTEAYARAVINPDGLCTTR